MKTEVDNYRGFEIRFDTDNETFECDIDDSRSVKKSYPAVKKFIDEYIKDNSEFKPFKVEPSANASWGGEFGTIIGIRKDGRFIIELPEGEKKQISDYEMDRYCLPNPVNEPIKKQISEINALIEQKRKDIEALKSNLVIKTLKDVYPQYKPV